MSGDDLENIINAFCIVGASSVGIGSLYLLFSSYSIRLKKPKLKSLTKFIIDISNRTSFSQNPEEVDKKIKRVSEYYADVSDFEKQAAMIQLERLYNGLPADLNKFLDHFSRFIKNNKFSYLDILDKLISKFVFEIIRKIIHRETSTGIELISTSFNYVKSRDIAKFLEEWNNYGRKDNLAVKAAYVMTLERLVQESESILAEMNKQQQVDLRRNLIADVRDFRDTDDLLRLKIDKEWQRFLNYLIEHYEFSNIVTEAEKKRILTVNLYDALRLMLRFKGAGSRVELEDEMQLLNELKSISDNKRFKVVDPIRVFQSGDLYYLAEKFVNGRTMSDYLKQEKDLDKLRLAVDYTSLVHARVMPRFPRKDYLADLIKKLQSSRLPDRLKCGIIDNIGFMLRDFNDEDIVFDRDAIPDNYIFGEDGNIYAIDLANRGSTHAEMDLTKLLNRDLIFSLDKKGDEQKQEIIIATYVPGFNSRSKRQIKEDYFYRRLIASTAYKSMLYFIFAQKHAPDRLERAREFLQNGAHDLELLVERFGSKYSTSEIEQIKRMTLLTKEIWVMN